MGQYAEMMLDGTCCSCCGEFIGGGDGYAVLCAGCEDDQGHETEAAGSVHCDCGKRFASKRALHQHRRDSPKHKDS